MRLQTPLRRLLGLAVAGLAVIAPAPALAHGGAAVFTETNASANAVQVYTQAGDGSCRRGELRHGRRGHRRRGPGLPRRARARAGLAARGQRRLERRLRVPRARDSARARESRAFRWHDAEQRHDPPRRRIRAQRRRHGQHQRLQARPARARAAERRHPAAVVRNGRRGAGLLHARRRPARRLGEGRQHDRHLPRRPLGPRRSRHAPRLGGAGPIPVALSPAAKRQRNRRYRSGSARERR